MANDNQGSWVELTVRLTAPVAKTRLTGVHHPVPTATIPSPDTVSKAD